MSIKCLHRCTCARSSIYILPTKHLLYRSEEHLAVHRGTDVLHVINVKLKFLRPRDVVATVHLCPSAHARSHVMTMVLLLTVKRQILHQQRARTYERHVALQDVYQLRQLVDRRGTDEPAHFGQSVSIGKEVALGIPLVRHRLELQRLEYLLVLARTGLGEEYPPKTILVGEEQQDNRGYENR